MGFIAVPNPPFVPQSPLAAAIARMPRAADYLAGAWDGCLTRDVLWGLCTEVAQTFNLDANAGDVGKRKNYKLPQGCIGYLSRVNDKASNSISLKFVVGASTIGVLIKPDGNGVASTICPACAQPIGNKPALAHNIVPQETWKAIIDAVIGEFLENAQNKTLIDSTYGLPDPKDPGLPKRIQAFSSFEAKYCKTGTSDVDFDALKNKDKNEKLLSGLKAQGVIMSEYAASDTTGKQCLNCESMHGNATLLQRYQLASAGKLPVHPKAVAFDKLTFVGLQFAPDFNSPSGSQEALENATRRQIGRFLLAVEKKISEIYGQVGKIANPTTPEPLLFFILDHWDEFVWTFRSYSLAKCNIPYGQSGQGEQLKFAAAPV